MHWRHHSQFYSVFFFFFFRVTTPRLMVSHRGEETVGHNLHFSLILFPFFLF